MGGGETWDLLVQHPMKFAAAIQVSATGGDLLKASVLRNTPLWVFHGALDLTVYVSEARQMIAALERAGATAVYTAGLSDSLVEERIRSGAKLLYTEYPDGRHDIAVRAYTESLLMPWLFLQQITTGIGEHPLNSVPMEYSLSQNYPNPFNPSTTIKFELPKPARVRLSVYDILGREVSVLVNEKRDAGVHEVKFDAAGLASGVYFYMLQAGDFIQTRKMFLIR
jgi:hypothetical protein